MVKRLFVAVLMVHLLFAADMGGYELNFDNVPISEFIKLVMKLTKKNIVYNQDELNFNVSIISEENTSLENIESILIQLLRVNGFALSEDNGNWVISTNPDVKQIPTVLGPNDPVFEKNFAGYVTKIFPIRSQNPATLVQLINSMISSKAIVQVSASTHQLIVTDSIVSIQQIQKLLDHIDAPGSPYEIAFISSGLVSPDELMALLKELMAPMTESSIYKLMQQEGTDNLIVISTPPMIEKTKQVVDNLNKEPSIKRTGRTLSSGDFFIYHLQSGLEKELRRQLRSFFEQAHHMGYSQKNALEIIDRAQWVPETNSMIFMGDPTSLNLIKDVLSKIKITAAEQSVSNIFIVRLEYQGGDYVLREVKQTISKLKKMTPTPSSLIETLESAQYNAGSNSIMISGTEPYLTRAQEIIQSFDTPIKSVNSEIFLYKPQSISPEELMSTLRAIAKHSDEFSPAPTPLSALIQSMRLIPDAHAIQFVGTGDAIEQLKTILPTIDVQGKVSSGIQEKNGVNFFIYRSRNVPVKELLDHLKDLVNESAKLSRTKNSLTDTINKGRIIDNTNSIVFTGSKADLTEIENLIQQIDAGSTTPLQAVEGYELYQPVYMPAPDLINMLKNFESHLQTSGIQNLDLKTAIDRLNFIQKTNTIIVSGTKEATGQVMELLKRFDNQAYAPTQEKSIELIEDSGFLIYKLQYQPGQSIVGALKQIGTDLVRNKTDKKTTALTDAIQTVQWIQPTNSLLATGEPNVLTKLKELMESIDRPQKQVFIEVLVIDATIGADTEFGLMWGSQGKINNRVGYGLGNYGVNDGGSTFANNINKISATTVPSGSDIPPQAGGLLGIIGDIVLHKGKSYIAMGSLLNAIQSNNSTTIVLAQKVIAQDNEVARIFSGDNIPFTGSLVTTQGLTQTTNANLEYRNVGVTLQITPIIGENDTITMEIKEEISQEEDSGSTQSSSSVQGIRTSRTSLQTKATVPDGKFLILSGTMRNSTARLVTGIPCLGGLPIIGAIFSENTKLVTKHNVIMFIKPRIIKSEDIYQEVTATQVDLYTSPNQSVPEDSDAGLDLLENDDTTESIDGD